jgi:hypothetical protein
MMRCADCNGTNIQISLPTWYDANSLDMIEMDVEADALDYYCDDCGESCDVEGKPSYRQEG